MNSSEMKITCPDCSKDAVLLQLIQKIPNFGDLLFSTTSCDHCGAKYSDVMPAEFHEPKVFEKKIENEKDMETKIVKSSSCLVEIPELGMDVEPANSSQGYFTNIEGLLEKFEDVLEMLLRDAKKGRDKNKERIVQSRMKKLLLAKQAKIPFTVIVKDPYGNSSLLGPGVKEKILTEKEIQELREMVQ
ncbi:MAG: ZPR1 zinc finger domain-containing protein [Candidatus Diapherotrites archaeon]|nr:ZPR1 zinc finger domain-containing protein [Candidatus Diapherotrites archaeon]